MGIVARCVRVGGLALCVVALATPFSWAATRPLHWPLDRDTRVLTGGFGEPRANHFHGGLDFSTQRATGVPVLAPAAGVIERVRTSGSGYGRSLYLRTDAGELIVFGHLDAFAPAIAAFSDSVQRATGDYEQDTWVPDGRFRLAEGERVGWSGQSGAGPPHLHVEVRHGDFALSPLLAGLAVPDTLPPALEQVVVEPLDEGSFVGRRASPHTLKLKERADTLVVQGRVRLTVRAWDATNESRRLPPRAVGARWDGGFVECRMDSISWAGEMSQIDWVLDLGRVTGSEGVILDAPAGWRPRFMKSSRPDPQAVDLIHVAAGDPPRPLDLYARDAAGHETSRRVWLRGPSAHEQGPDPSPAPAAKAGAKAGAKPAALPNWSFAELPGRRLRIRVTGTPPGLRDVRIERGASQPPMPSATASWDGGGWTAILEVPGLPDPDGFWLKGTGSDGKAWWHRGTYALWPTASQLPMRHDDWAVLVLEEATMYEPGVALLRGMPLAGLPAGATGIRAVLDVQPATVPMKRPGKLTLTLPAGMTAEHTTICHRDSERDRWEWTDAAWDSVARTFTLEVSHLGQFALIRDEAPPLVTLLPARRVPAAGPYSTWSLTASVSDALSGVRGRACAFTVDGVRVPTEWDPEARVLRWRPLSPPAAGTHRYRVEAVDRAGNRTVRSGTFVIGSGKK